MFVETARKCNLNVKLLSTTQLLPGKLGSQEQLLIFSKTQFLKF